MYNAFLVIRTVCFALLTYFHVLILIFASWSIAAAGSSGTSAPGASVFLITSSILILLLVPIAYLAELICVRARPAQVRLECAWTALMSVFQLAGSIDVTLNGPPMYCQTHSQWAMCASSHLLCHVSWLATLIILSYCLTICVVSATHATSVPDVWITPVPRVPWFCPDVEKAAPEGTPHLSTDKRTKTLSTWSTWSDSSCPVSKYITERWDKFSRTERQPVASGPIIFKKGHQSTDSNRPMWARQQRTRRGVDTPFANPLPRPKEQPVLSVPPPRTHSRQAVTSRNSCFVEVNDQSDKRSNSFSTLAPQTSPVFPRRIDPDLPIPRPSRSEWVRADAVAESAAHTEFIPSS